MGIPVGIITGESTDIVRRRAEKLRVDFLFQGIENKLEIVNSLCNTLLCTPSDVAYIGDDIGDMAVLKTVRISAVPSQSPAYVKRCAKYVMNKAGGEGVFREFVEFIVEDLCKLSIDEILFK